MIGVLRENNGHDPAPATPQPTLRDINRLVDDTRSAGTNIDFEMSVARADDLPEPLGRDAYRIVQEALTNVGSAAGGCGRYVQAAVALRRLAHGCPAAAGACLPSW